ncbi:alpha/beta hydrolase [Corynebacterium uterequi]|uniref:Lysophospholipase n=1 Tax=Corynebacterium uterequi TaxID=1072256 RepID=A0A0G3HJD2_9CORY|nr:alpha/beta hydrolase [Corynebacterium uterequi]AKK12063.1 lysophospholipase [Corynebacterium uterequi]
MELTHSKKGLAIALAVAAGMLPTVVPVTVGDALTLRGTAVAQAAEVTRDTTWLTSRDGRGTKIFVQRQTIPNARGTVVVVHGLGEHQGRYDYVAQRLLDAGYNVYRMDHRGHGITASPESGNPEGLGDINSFAALVDDIDMVVDYSKQQHPGSPTFMLGHSMGAFAVQFYGIKYPGKLVGIVSNGGGITTNISGGSGEDPTVVTPEAITQAQKELGLTSSEALPMVEMSSINAEIARVLVPNRLDAEFDSGLVGFSSVPVPENDFLSIDEDVVEAYRNDPLVARELSLSTLSQVGFAVAYDALNADHFTYPTLIMHGTKDKLVPTYFANNWYNAIASEDKEIILWEGQKHEVFNEPAKEEAMDTVIAWINKHNV